MGAIRFFCGWKIGLQKGSPQGAKRNAGSSWPRPPGLRFASSGLACVGWASVFLLAHHWGSCGFRSAWADDEAVCPPYRAESWDCVKSSNDHGSFRSGAGNPCLTAPAAGFAARECLGRHSHAGAWERSNFLNNQKTRPDPILLRNAVESGCSQLRPTPPKK